MTKIAWIGAGIMGKPMALHLANAGHHVTIYTRTLAKVADLPSSVRVVSSIAEAVREADIVFTMVGFPSEVEEVYQSVFQFARPQTICVDLTTSSPTLAQQLAKQGSIKNIVCLDSPVTGGDIGARNATLSIMVGGDEAAYHTILPLLQKMGKTITFMGSSGNGQHAKLANQTVIAGTIGALAESLAYAKSKGLDLTAMLQVLKGGSANSWQVENNGPKMIQHNYAPGFYIKHFIKDLKLILDEKKTLAMPVVEQVTKVYQRLIELGHSDHGTQAIIEFYLQQLA